MKRFGFIAAALLFGGGAVAAEPVQQLGTARVKSVKIYPSGVYVTLSVEASLKGAARERILFPDLWYADRETVEIRLMPTGSGKGITFIPEVSPAAQNENVRLYRLWTKQRDAKLEQLGRLRSDSMALEREMDFLKTQTSHSWKSLEEAKSVEKWMKERFPDLYERQRRIREAIREQHKLLKEDERVIASIGKKYSKVTLAWAWVEAPGPGKVEFEVSYYAKAAEWKPIYFFRFDSERQRAELEYQAAVRQWTEFPWNSVPAVLSYSTPMRALRRPKLYPRIVDYRAPAPTPVKRDKVQVLDLNAPQEMMVDVSRLGGTYMAEEVVTENTYAAPAALDVSENNVGYRLARPLTLASSSDGAQTYQTVRVRRDTIPVLYEYEVTPKVSTDVLLLARIPNWQQLHLADGRVNVFCDGRMLGQSSLSVRSTQDTLTLPLTSEPLVAVERTEAGDYRERVSGSKKERTRSYEIRIKNNKEFPVNLTVKDQYPVSNTDEVEVTLTEGSGARADAATGMLTWNLDLAPGAERILKFGYTVRYPKDGKVYF
ncbi:DUF4139 domain-containing protein [uncultured Rikenella sp.]|uniref:DUF4139 domain-containing protein n=1 Tax=uncultured Rikenella sp. TaxID=368003 RepID=UPI00262F060C|nr:DUF4139 domain-containing protein [uncultured Rikenella sp.]